MEPVAAAVAAAVNRAPGRVLVGFSGGLDSTVLLHAFAACAEPQASPIAVHVNHGLQEAAADWQRHCETVCRELGVSLVSRNVTVAGGGSLEARARAARYEAFAALLEPDDWLLLAHHRDDQAETVLLRLLQGRGMYGMPAARPLGAGRVVRPLLGLPRSALVRYAREHELRWVEDPSNADMTVDRSYLRHRVMPELRRRWPEIDTTLLGAMARHHLADRLLLDGLGELVDAAALPVAEVMTRPWAERAELLRLWLAARGVPAPRRAALEEFLRQLTAASHRQPELAVAGGVLRRYRQAIHLAPAAPRLEESYPLAGDTLKLPHGTLTLVAEEGGWRPRGAVRVRFRRGGERLGLTAGAPGANRQVTLKQLMQEAGLPPWLRPLHPLVCDDEGLVDVPGIAGRPGTGQGWRARWLPLPGFRWLNSAAPEPPGEDSAGD